jgi:hypothetical protein
MPTSSAKLWTGRAASEIRPSLCEGAALLRHVAATGSRPGPRAQRVVAARRRVDAGPDPHPRRGEGRLARRGRATIRRLRDALVEALVEAPVFVTPCGGRCRNGTLGVWLDAADVARLNGLILVRGRVARGRISDGHRAVLELRCRVVGVRRVQLHTSAVLNQVNKNGFRRPRNRHAESTPATDDGEMHCTSPLRSRHRTQPACPC